MARDLSSPLASTFGDDKKKPKKKKQATNQQSMMLDTSGGGLSDAQIAAQNAKKAKRKSDRDRNKEVRVKKRTERQSDRSEKRAIVKKINTDNRESRRGKRATSKNNQDNKTKLSDRIKSGIAERRKKRSDNCKSKTARNKKNCAMPKARQKK